MNKSLTIIGKENPVIDVGGKDLPVELSGTNITIEGFVLKNSRGYGVYIIGSSYSDNK